MLMKFGYPVQIAAYLEMFLFPLRKGLTGSLFQVRQI